MLFFVLGRGYGIRVRICVFFGYGEFNMGNLVVGVLLIVNEKRFWWWF